MALDIKLENQTIETSTICLTHSEFNTLVPFFNKLKTKTGIVIDEYSDTKLCPEHSKVLVDLIGNSIEDKRIVAFVSLLRKSSKESLNLLFIGD